MRDAGHAGRLPLGPGGEFDLIRAFTAGDTALPAGVALGPGDDAAVLEGGWVVSTDLSVEDVHFRRAWLRDEEIGWRAAAAALSDVAAMGAEAVGVLVSLAAPPGREVDLHAVQRGVRAAAAACGAAVLGGDLSASPGPLFLDLVVLGRAERPVGRSGARPGDEVWVSGVLGGSAAAVRAWSEGRDPAPALRRRFARPEPRVALGRALGAAGAAAAMIDLSDGLAGDAAHLAAASGVRVVLEAGRVPVDEAAREALGPEAAREAALHGGEDYELCFAARPGAVDPPRLADAVGALGGPAVPLTRVGRVEEGEGVWLALPGEAPRRLERGGHDHWALERAAARGAARP